MLNYIFWRFRVRKEKGNKDDAYVTTTFFFGTFFILIPLIIVVNAFLELPKLPKIKIYQYLLVVPVVILLSSAGASILLVSR